MAQPGRTESACRRPDLRLRAWLRHAPALLVVLLLLLDPLACIVHCHLPAVLFQRTPVTTIEGQAVVICGHAGGTSDAPAPLVPDLLRMLFELAPAHNRLLLLLLLLLLLHPTTVRPLLPQHTCAPPLPPPRRVAN
jgi:hypothetical protein